MQYSASATLKVSPKEILKHFKGRFKLKFDNGVVVESTGLQLAISRYVWEINKKFPKIGLLPAHFIGNYMKDCYSFKSDTVLKLKSAIMGDVFTVYDTNVQEEYYKIQETVWASFVSVADEIRNDIQVLGARFHATMSVEDIVAIMKSKDILDIDKANPVNRDTITDPNTVPSIYKKKQKVLESGEFFDNNVAVMMRSGTIKIPQLMQCLGPRGSVTDMNSNIFPEPIQVGYLNGLRRIYDVLIESRTAAMSLNNQSGPLKFTEYLSRRIQLIGMELKNLHFGDCGSQYHLEFQVRGERPDSVISDLKLLEGMNYWDETEKKYRPVRETDTHLIGKRIKLRTVLGCQHKDPNGVCSTCFGQASRNVARYRNLGHFCIISFTQIITQLVLSTKHHTSSAAASMVNLTDYTAKYMKEVQEGLGIGIKQEVLDKHESVKIVVPEEVFEGLTDIQDVKDVNILSPRRTSRVNRIVLRLTTNTKKGVEVSDEVLDVVPYRDEGYLSMAMLKHMKRHGWTLDKDGNIEIELTNFDSSQSVIEITAKQFDMFAYSKGIEKILKSSVKDIKKRATEVTPESFLMDLVDVINAKLGINLSIMQVVAYTMLATDVSKKDYSLPKPWTKHGVGTMEHLIKGRSLSGALAYEKQGDTLMSTYSFTRKNRTDHPMDELFTPEQMRLEYLDRP